MLDVIEVAKRLGVNNNTIRRLIRAGELKAIQVGKVFRISEDNFTEFLLTQTEKVKA